MFIVNMDDNDSDSNSNNTQIKVDMDMDNLAGFMCYISKVIKILLSLILY